MLEYPVLTVLLADPAKPGAPSEMPLYFKGPVHKLYMDVLIKGHCRYDKNAIGLVTFETQGKEKSAYLFSKISKIRCPIPNLGAPIPNFCATLFQT